MKNIALTYFREKRFSTIDAPIHQPGVGELLLKITAASLNYRDVEIFEGRYGMPVELPLVPLSDAVGTVVEVGENTDGFAVGDRVNPMFFPDWISGEFRSNYFKRQLGGSIDGVLREYMTVRANAVVHAPSHLSDDAASLPVAALTAWSALTEARFQAGQSMLIIGTGGVALFAMQFARALGGKVIVLSSSDEKLKRVLGLGADHVINYKQREEWGGCCA